VGALSARSPRLLSTAGLAIGAALALAACTVNVEGAPCSSPGDTVDCPDKQACGNDLRCSARALDCKTTGTMCTPGPAQCISAQVSKRCDGSDPVCGTWVTDDCAARNLECGTRGSGVCECPEPSSALTTVVADPGGSPDPQQPPYPTGQADPNLPRECRFGRLMDAIAALSTTVPGTVEIAGAAGTPAVFGTPTGETWPLVIPANVAILGAPAPAGPTIVRAGPDPGTAGTILRVTGTLEALTIEARGPRGAGVELVCGAGAAPTLRDVTVDGGGTLDPGGVVTGGLRTGIAVAGACGGLVQRALVSAVAGPGLAVEQGAGSAATVQILGGTFRGNEVGIWLRGGTTSVGLDGSNATTVTGNAWMGIAIGGGPDAAAPAVAVPVASLEGAIVNGNAGTGIVVARLDESGSYVSISGADVTRNGQSARVQTRPTGTPAHAVGGVLLALGQPLTLAFSGNRLWSNAGDQLVFDSAATWRLGPSVVDQCGFSTNVFACVATGQLALGIVHGGSVSAPYNLWPGPKTPPWTDWLGAGVTVPVGQFCLPGSPGVPQPPDTCN
jgi:hypothetical protein